MKILDISHQRLVNQQIEGSEIKSVKELVKWMGAFQAQDYNMSKWAIGARISNVTHATVEKALTQKEIIRTHVLRPTWHIVPAEDVRWMLQLTAPQIKISASSAYKNLELDDKIFNKTNKIICKALQGENQLTRQELVQIINAEGIATNPLRASHIMFQAELDMLVCNGALKNNQQTYALLDEVVPPDGKIFIKEEALAELARRYFTSHGPATLQDFHWWSGLKMSDAKLSLELIKEEFLSQEMDGKQYWFKAISGHENISKTSLHLLPAFDEFLVSYKDRSATLHLQNTRNNYIKRNF